MAIIIPSSNYAGYGPILKIKKAGRLESIGLLESDAIPTMSVSAAYNDNLLGPFLTTSLLKENNFNTGKVSFSSSGISCDQFVEWEIIKNMIIDPYFNDIDNSISKPNSTSITSERNDGKIYIHTSSEGGVASFLLHQTPNALLSDNSYYVRFNIFGTKNDSSQKIIVYMNGEQEEYTNSLELNKDISYIYNNSSDKAQQIGIIIKFLFSSIDISLGFCRPIILNLTEFFGSEITPTKEWCDKNIIFTDNLTKTIIKQKQVTL